MRQDELQILSEDIRRVENCRMVMEGVMGGKKMPEGIGKSAPSGECRSDDTLDCTKSHSFFEQNLSTQAA